jgi:hypothetical protein
MRARVGQELRNRYQEQAQRWPLLRGRVTEDQYVAANIRDAMRNARGRETR